MKWPQLHNNNIDYWSPSSFHNGPPTIKIVKHIDSLINYLYDPPTKFTLDNTPETDTTCVRPVK